MSTAVRSAGRGRRFVVNVLWSWTGVAVNILVAALLSPYIIRQLGADKFSIWTVALSFVEYFWLIDIGLRSATVKFSAEYRATGNTRALSEVLNTGLLYSTLAGLLIAAAAAAGAGYAASVLRIDEPAFPFLIRIVGLSWAVGMSMSILTAVLEGHQRFDTVTRVFVTGMIFRSTVTAGLVAAGYGLHEMGLILLSAQVLMAVVAVFSFRRAIKDASISVADATWPTLKRMASYGAHSFKANIATRMLYQSTPFLIAYFLPLPNVAYYTVPFKIIDYLLEAIGRVGMVTMPNAAELMAQGNRSGLVNLGLMANRYSLMLFMPVPVFLLTYGHELYSLWITPEFAANSSYLLPVLLIGPTVAAGQFNSISVLFGIGRQQRYSTFLLLEAVSTVAAFAFLLPRFGLIGAAAATAVLATLNRGVMVCILLSRELGLSPVRYAASIYTRPVAVGVVCLLALRLLKQFVPGTSWLDLILAGGFLSALYLPLAFLFGLSPAHREIVVARIRTLLRRA